MFESPIVLTFVGGFVGAFAAFLLMRLNTFIDKVNARQKRHYTELVALQHSLNKFLDEVDQHSHSITDLINTYDSVKPPIFTFTYSLPNTIVFDETRLINLLNLDLINDLATFARKVQRVNGDTQIARIAYEKTLEAKFAGQLDDESYIGICRNSAKSCKRILLFSEQLKDETVDVISKVRVRLNRDKYHWVNRLTVRSTYECDFPREIEKERSILLKEMERIGAESQGYIDDVMKGQERPGGGADGVAAQDDRKA
jgi:hypothetical protein